MKIGIFCSANENIAPVYFEKAEQLARWIGKNGHTLVYGGCDMGLMRCIGHTVKDNGGMTIGIVPDMIEKGGRKASCLDVEIPVDNLSDRKDLLLLHSDIIIALPGGIGTLDEVFTVAAAKTIGYHDKRVLLYNVEGFWDTAVALMDDLQQKGMIRGDYHDMLQSVNSFDELLKEL